MDDGRLQAFRVPARVVVEPGSDLVLQVGLPYRLPVLASVLDHGRGWVIWLRWNLDDPLTVTVTSQVQEEPRSMVEVLEPRE